MYAIFESGGKQHRAEPGQRLSLEKLDAPVGERVTFDRVLLLRDPDSGDCRVGSPYLEGAQVSASVVAHFRDRKIIVFKRKRRKGYRKKQGHRQYRTQVRVEAIHPADADAPDAASGSAEAPLANDAATPEVAPTEGAPAEAETVVAATGSDADADADESGENSGKTD